MTKSVEQLIAFHESCKVKYRYMRVLDTHDWELMRGCFSLGSGLIEAARR